MEMERSAQSSILSCACSPITLQLQFVGRKGNLSSTLAADEPLPLDLTSTNVLEVAVAFEVEHENRRAMDVLTFLFRMSMMLTY